MELSLVQREVLLAQNGVTLSMATNMPCPVASLVKRVPSKLGWIVQPWTW